MIDQLRIPTPVGDFDALAAGPEDGRSVLLLHGFPQSSLEWDHQLRALAAAGYRAVAPDQRGYSRGVRPPDVADYAIEELAADVLRIADGLGWTRFDLVGHDWGAALAWVIADRHPDRLRTLTAVSVPHPAAFAEAMRNDDEQQGAAAHLEIFRQEGAAEGFLLGNGGAGLHMILDQAVPAASVQAYIARLSEPGAVVAALNWYRATRPQEVEAGPITVPTLYVWGTEDAGVKSVAALATKSWVSADYRFESLEGISHWVPEEAAERLSSELLAHLERNGV
jgi:pimeloyl-ACP methyl ester carboxylesterase